MFFEFFNKLRFMFSHFMIGRYGFDVLSKVMLIFAVIFGFISGIPYLRFFYLLFIILVFLVWFRFFSRNIGARKRELYKYFEIKNKIKDKIALKKKIWGERKTHRYFKCAKCKAFLRVPKGKGKIEVTCRVCGEKIIRRS